MMDSMDSITPSSTQPPRSNSTTRALFGMAALLTVGLSLTLIRRDSSNMTTLRTPMSLPPSRPPSPPPPRQPGASLSGSTLLPNRPPPPQLRSVSALDKFAVNAGGDTIQADGVTWEGDLNQNLEMNPMGLVKAFDGCAALNNVPTQLYCTLRHNPNTYELQGFEASNSYTIDFYLMTDETWRRFHVNVQGQRRLTDWTKDRGVGTPYTLTADNITVDRNGIITIAFEQIGNPPLLAGFRIRATGAANPPPSTNPSPANPPPTSSAPVPVPSGGGPITYRPGKLTLRAHNLLLSEGLNVEIIARSGQRIDYANGQRSQRQFHRQPDAAGVFPDTRSSNPGGWVYVSNSEVRPTSGNSNPGGVGAITFNASGKVVDYKMLLENTKSNCGGGKTSWGAWISGEEYPNVGRIWQVDPFGNHDPVPITMGDTNKGLFESFAYDDRNSAEPRFFMTKDHAEGALRRFTPNTVSGITPWELLTQPGVIEYLEFLGNDHSGSFRWTTNLNAGRKSAKDHYPNSEGITVRGKELFFITKVKKLMYILDLDAMTYKSVSTRAGQFLGQPDQVESYSGSTFMIFTEDGSDSAGIHARRGNRFYTMLESTFFSNETTGIALSPDKKHLYFAYQDDGVLFDLTRNDGRAFDAETLPPQYNNRRV